MSYFVHPRGLCESEEIGSGTRIEAFAHVLAGAVIGQNCSICDHVFIESEVRIGDRVTVKCGVQLWAGLRIEDDVFIGPNATFTNEHFPHDRSSPERSEATRIGRHASIGANATILPGLTIGQYSMVGAGAVVTRSVPPYAIVVGNPARIIGYATNASRDGQREMANPRVERENHKHSAVRGVQLKNFPMFEDMRGALSVGHFEREVPFHPSRYFLVFDVPSKDVRGEHAHKVCEQFLICVKGSLRVVADDGENREAFVLDRPGQGLYLPAMTWASQYAYSKDAVLLVFASHDYDPDDYIRDYGMFQSLVGAVEMG